VAVPSWFIFLGVGFALLILTIGILFAKFGPFSAVKLAKFGGTIGLIVAVGGTTLQIAAWTFGQNISSTVIVQQFWPKQPPGLAYQSPVPQQVVSGGFSEAQVFVSNLGWDVRWLFVAQSLCSGAVIAVIALTVRTIAVTLEQGSGFQGVSTAWLKRGAWIVGISGLAQQLFGQLKNYAVTVNVLPANFAMSVDSSSIPNPWVDSMTDSQKMFQIFGYLQPNLSIPLIFDFWPVMVAIGFYVFAQILQQGKRLEADTEGLI